MSRRPFRPLALACCLGLVAPLSALPAAGADPEAPETLVPIGGGYEPEAMQSFTARVADQATGETVDIFVVPSSYGDAPEDREENLELAQERTEEVEDHCEAVVDLDSFPGGCEATLLVLLDRADAMDPANSVAVTDPDADGVFVLGGDQVLAMQVLANSPAETHLEQAFEGGVVLGGTSAGNAVESVSMGAGYSEDGWPWNALERDKTIIYWGDDPASDERGLAFGSQEIILDQHFYQRGRFGRLLNWTALSAERYGGAGKLGVGVDWATGVVIEDDRTVTDPFGNSSSAVLDLSHADEPEWVGPADTLSVRGVLTHLIAPGAGMSYDVPGRTAAMSGEPVAAPERGTHPALHRRVGGQLYLGGGMNDDGDSAALTGFVDALRTRGSGHTEVVLVAAGYEDVLQAQTAAADYGSALADAGWDGPVKVLVQGQDPLPASVFARAVGVVFIGGDQSLMAPAVADRGYADAVRKSVQRPTPVLTDGAATAVLGAHYVANPTPGDDYEDVAIAEFRADGNDIVEGLGVLPGVSVEPTLTYDYRWGRLYGAAAAHPQERAVGISELTALRLDRSGSEVVGERSVIVLDGSTADWGVGSNGARAAVNVWLDAYGPGDSVA